MESSSSYFVDPKAVEVENVFLDFLKSFRLDTTREGFSFYQADIESIVSNDSTSSHDRTTLFVDFTHLMSFDVHLQEAISEDYLRFEPFLKNACKRFSMGLKNSFVGDGSFDKDINVAFYNLPVVKRLRDLTTAEIGKLTSVTGVVTRTSEVRPELLLGAFKCLDCGSVIKNVDQEFKYTEPKLCTNATCANRARWALLRQESKFVDWQRVRMQETSKEIPAGSLPRSLDVILRYETVEQASAGDTVVFTGTLVVIPDIMALVSSGERSEVRRDSNQRKNSMYGQEGLKGLRATGVRDLNYRLAFIANSVQISGDIKNQNPDKDEVKFTDEEKSECQRMREMPDFFNKLVNSIAPTVFGHQDIKRAILLLLVGGVPKITHEGINLRGDINVCVVGDPSCAKSQFLKFSAGIVPRSVYTCGKSSSAAGLTATVAKEPETGDFCIEAGALMLADNGICCIDEFDKMDVKDQTAIHEAMEQQTISITKAGIQATLNARTSVLAAANPTGGRYDKSRSLRYNVALPPAILSRFDLVYVMIDDPDDDTDYRIVNHIVKVHQKLEAALRSDFSISQLKLYIRMAKTRKPKLSLEARKLLVESYVSLRRGDATPGTKVAYRMTVRQLEALIRLSESIARCHLENEVTAAHVQLAVRLLQTSIISVESSEIDISDFQDDDADGGDNPTTGAQPNSVVEPPPPDTNGVEIYPDSGNRRKMVISDEYFKRITDALIMRLRQHEEAIMRDGSGLSGMKQKDLIEWYVAEQNKKSAYQNVNEALDEISRLKAIIECLVQREGHLIVIDDGGEGEDGGKDSSRNRRNRILVAAPNYVIQ